MRLRRYSRAAVKVATADAVRTRATPQPSSATGSMPRRAVLAGAGCMALSLGLAAVPVVHALRGGTGRFQDVGLMTAQPARTDGYNHFLVTVGGPGAPRPQGQNLDPVLWQPGWSRSAYLANLDALEAQGLTVSVYTQPDGVIRARLR